MDGVAGQRSASRFYESTAVLVAGVMRMGELGACLLARDVI